MTNNPLTNLKETIEQHWRTYLPKMTAMLEAEGDLQAAIDKATEQTEDAMLNAISTGTPLWEAWPTFREQWAFLPAEEGYEASSNGEASPSEDDENWLDALGYNGPEDWAIDTEDDNDLR